MANVVKLRIRYQQVIDKETGELGPKKETEKYFNGPTPFPDARSFARKTLKADKIVSITKLAE